MPQSKAIATVVSRKYQWKEVQAWLGTQPPRKRTPPRVVVFNLDRDRLERQK